MHIDSITELCKALHTASCTAPELIPACAVNLEVTGSHRLEIGRHTALGILRRENGIVVRSLIKVHILHIAGYLEELTAELEHIVGVAGLTVAVCTLLVEDIVHAEVFPLAVSACDIGMVCNDHIPECFGVMEIA